MWSSASFSPILSFTENLKQKEVEAWVLDFGEDWARGAGVIFNFMLQFHLFC